MGFLYFSYAYARVDNLFKSINKDTGHDMIPYLLTLQAVVPDLIVSYHIQSPSSVLGCNDAQLLYPIIIVNLLNTCTRVHNLPEASTIL